MKETTFRIRAYSWGELANLYNPHLHYTSASKRLGSWINHNPELYRKLCRTGWRKGCRVLTPLQVKIVVDHLGEP